MGLFIQTSVLAPLRRANEHHDVDDYEDDHEPTKLITKQRADKAYSDGLRQQTTKHHAINRMGKVARSVGRRIEIP